MPATKAFIIATVTTIGVGAFTPTIDSMVKQATTPTTLCERISDHLDLEHNPAWSRLPPYRTGGRCLTGAEADSVFGARANSNSADRRAYGPHLQTGYALP